MTALESAKEYLEVRTNDPMLDGGIATFRGVPVAKFSKKELMLMIKLHVMGIRKSLTVSEEK